jgi:glutaredoxin 3
VPDIEIYTKDYCPYCKMAKSILQRKGAAFLEHSLSDNPDLFETMAKRAQGRRTVPQIFIGGVGIGGADELSLLQERGQLDLILRDERSTLDPDEPCFRCLVQ